MLGATGIADPTVATVRGDQVALTQFRASSPQCSTEVQTKHFRGSGEELLIPIVRAKKNLWRSNLGLARKNE